jgi:hypothetical protein
MAKYNDFIIERGQNSVNTFIPYPSNFTVALTLDGLTQTTYTIEADDAGKKPRMVVFSFTADTFVQFDDPAVIPVSDITDGTAPILNPSHRAIRGGVESISCISGVAGVVTMEFYR